MYLPVYSYIQGGHSAALADLDALQQEISTVSQRASVNRAIHPDVNSIIVIGKTGHGKSTLVTHLAGRQLQATLGQRGNIILDTLTPLDGFNIGHGARAGTQIPTSWFDEQSRTVYWDCPGFSAPEGAQEDILNAYSVQQLFKTPSNTKIVIAIKSSDLLDRGTVFGEILKKVIDTFPDSAQLHDSLSLVVTSYCAPLNISRTFQDFLTDPGSNANFKDTRVKALLRFLIDHNDRTSIFPSQTMIGDYAHPESREEIQRSIGTSNFVRNITNTITISAESRELVRVLSAQTNASIVNYTIRTISPAIEASILNIINRHAKTAREMKNDFATHVQSLNTIREDTATHYIDDLQPIFEQIGLGSRYLAEIRRNVSLIRSFKPLAPGLAGVDYKIHEWKNALRGVIAKLNDTSKAQETLEERKGRHIRSYTESCGNRSEGEARGGRWNRERRDVYMGRHCNEYAIDEKITTLFPAIGRRNDITTIVDDWIETKNPLRTQTDRGGETIIGYGSWH